LLDRRSLLGRWPRITDEVLLAELADERREFREEYFVRNAWPSAEQRSAIEQSLSLTFDAARSFATESEQ
jgi:hypothetical protein